MATSPDTNSIGKELAVASTIEKTRNLGNPTKMWLNNIEDWTMLLIDDRLDSTQSRT